MTVNCKTVLNRAEVLGRHVLFHFEKKKSPLEMGNVLIVEEQTAQQIHILRPFPLTLFSCQISETVSLLL